eukprot:CAMPEP_0180459090 /NCGR_PEP_ID=MMETSP1036_2-20121128/22675_1 /TAXON_ID=632150 /ORGANISM="Azadinium spinosum, Strain 3D9" /LENGTH=137 /DNA_ID=CAMNT_0022465751 /DNA_START=161 /DNA_END=574 /DNA_ORIENTATION=-
MTSRAEGRLCTGLVVLDIKIFQLALQSTAVIIAVHVLSLGVAVHRVLLNIDILNAHRDSLRFLRLCRHLPQLEALDACLGHTRDLLHGRLLVAKAVASEHLHAQLCTRTVVEVDEGVSEPVRRNVEEVEDSAQTQAF